MRGSRQCGRAPMTRLWLNGSRNWSIHDIPHSLHRDIHSSTNRRDFTSKYRFSCVFIVEKWKVIDRSIIDAPIPVITVGASISCEWNGFQRENKSFCRKFNCFKRLCWLYLVRSLEQSAYRCRLHSFKAFYWEKQFRHHLRQVTG